MAKKEITFEEICRDITARKFQPVYVLMGEEPFFIDQITDLLLKSVLEESERMSVHEKEGSIYDLPF